MSDQNIRVDSDHGRPLLLRMVRFMASTLTGWAGVFRVPFGIVVWLSQVSVDLDILPLPHNKLLVTLGEVCRQGKVALRKVEVGGLRRVARGQGSRSRVQVWGRRLGCRVSSSKFQVSSLRGKKGGGDWGRLRLSGEPATEVAALRVYILTPCLVDAYTIFSIHSIP